MADPDEEVGRQVIGGSHSRSRAQVSAGLKIDTAQLSKLKRHIGELKNVTKQWREEMEALSKAAGNLKSSMPGTGGYAAGTPRPASTDTNKPINSSPATTAAAGGGGGGFLSKLGGERFGGQGATRIGGISAIAMGVSNIIGTGVGIMDSRIDRGIAYATSADRLSLLTQQMRDMSQMQVMQMRQPLTNYRLGLDGPNALMQFQAQTGVQATQRLGASVEALRMSSGFTRSTGDILNEQRSLMDPAVANRMLFMLGTNAYNLGGGARDPLEVRYNIINSLGLRNSRLADSALTPGSITRARMADIGFDEQMQTSLIQYAQQQNTFEKRGGRGMYDPSDRTHQQVMGIENNLATQQEETERVRTAREEQFMVRQIDNMAALERSNQRLIETMQSLEDTLSGVIGARIGTRPLQRALLGTAGTGLMAAGAALSVTAPMVGIPMMAVGALGSAFGGDPANPDAESGGGFGYSSPSSASNDSEIMVPYGYNGNKVSLTQLKSSQTWQQINPRFRERLLKMMRANPNVGIGGGSRSEADQERMFRDRYRPTDKKTDIFWNGQYWEHVKGAPAAPPGRSMHEIGLAVDMVGDIEWMNANAGKFGLKHFANVNNEPWHVQPEGLPNSRFKYEQAGAPWGTDGKHSGTSGAGGSSEGHISAGHSGSTKNAFGSKRSPFAFGGGAHGTFAFGGSPRSAFGSSRSGGLINTSNRQLTGEEVARYAYNAGFRGDDLAAVVAISKRESGWRTGAYNPNRETQDDSYGLMQINMLGQMGVNRLRQFGISSNQDLYDPAVNMRAAFSLYQARGGSLYDWGAYKGKENTYNTNVSEAMQIVKDAGLYGSGDPIIDMAPTRAGGGGGGGQSNSSTTHITSSPTINVAPVINFSGTPATPDLRNIANTIGRMLKEEVDMLDLRNA